MKVIENEIHISFQTNVFHKSYSFQHNQIKGMLYISDVNSS